MIVNVPLVKIGTERTSTYGPMESATTALSTPPRMTRSIELFKQTFFTIKRSGLDIFLALHLSVSCMVFNETFQASFSEFCLFKGK